MNSKTKKFIIIAALVYIILVALSWFKFINNNSKDSEYRTGTYFCKISIINEGGTKVHKWDIAIAKNNTKSGIVENESNGKSLDKFWNTVLNINTKRLNLSLAIADLLLALIIFVYVQNGGKILKNKVNKKTIQIIIILFAILFIYRISISYIELRGLYKDINYYFN
ncbi:MAG: hypothetical protein LIR50_02550, partial [Bacillota bacterium]|nr:hypothetical protein [Bacillota bacterium]